jgi:DNA-binding winged helix-turn-helix (wHTH) protein/tetratricopeptide (TPR) repeat protein
MDRVEVPTRVFRFGLFEADASQNTLTRNGLRVKIQDQPFRVLVCLLERPGEIVSREELRQKIWPEGTYVDFDGSLNVILKKLRAAIDDDSDNPRFIETVPRRGYRFIAPVSAIGTRSGSEIIEAAPARVVLVSPVPPLPIVPESQPQTDFPRTRSSHRQSTGRSATFRGRVFAATALIFVAIGAGWVVSRYRSSGSVAPSRLDKAPVEIRKSVAVLGFQNISGRGSDAWLATAFSEMLNTELAGGEKLRLVPGEDVANLRLSSPWSESGTLDEETTSRIGTALNSDFLLLGSYTLIGKPESGQVRLDVRLQDAKSGEILSEIAEIGGTQDLFEIVSRAGGKLRDRLGVPTLEKPEDAGVLASLPKDREAARFYALGVVKLRQFDFLAAKDLLLQTTQADPKFSLAHTMLARAWGNLGYEQKRREEAKKAFDLASSLPRSERLLVEGDYYESIGDHETSASTYRTLFELFPDNVEYGLQLAGAQTIAGHKSEALATVARLRQLPSPASDDPNIDLVEARIVPVKADSLRLIRASLEKASAQGKKLVYAEGKHGECITLVYGEHPGDADATCQEAYDTLLAAGNRLAAADTLRLIADRQGAEGHNEESLATYRRVIAMLQSLGDHEKLGAVLNNMGSSLMNQGKLEAAEPLLRQAKTHFEQAGDRANTITAATNIADLLYLRGQLAAAERSYQQALEMCAAIDLTDSRYLLYRLADLQLAEGKLKEASLNAQRAISSGPNEAGPEMTSALLVSGEVSEAEGDLSAARGAFNQSLQISQRLGDITLVAEAQLHLADAAFSEGSLQVAEGLTRQAIAEFEKANSEPDLIGAHTLLSRVMLDQGRADESRKSIERATDLSRASTDPALKMPAAIQAARVAISGTDQKAGKAARQALSATFNTARKLGYYDLECEARFALSELDLKSDSARARHQFSQLSAEARSRGMELLARRAAKAAAAEASELALNKSNK